MKKKEEKNWKRRNEEQLRKAKKNEGEWQNEE